MRIKRVELGFVEIKRKHSAEQKQGRKTLTEPYPDEGKRLYVHWFERP